MAAESATQSQSKMISGAPSNTLLFSSSDLEFRQSRWDDPRYKTHRTEIEAAVRRLKDFLSLQVPKDRGKALQTVRTQWNSVEAWLRDTAFAAIVGQDAEAQKVALDAVDFFIEAFPPESRGDQSGWGSHDLAISFNLLEPILSEPQKTAFVETLGRHLGEQTRRMMQKEWFAFGPNASTRAVGGANWTALFSSNLGLTLLALRDTQFWNPTMMEDCLKLADNYLNEAISADGSMYEGTEYAVGFGTHHLPAFLTAARRAGFDIGDGNLTKMPDWVLAEILPWGYEAFDHNKSHGRLVPGALAAYLVSRQPNAAAKEFHRQSGLGSAFGINYAFSALIYGLPEEAPIPAVEVPSAKWFPETGIAIWRSSSDDNATMVLSRTYPVGAGHTHADQGGFLVVSNGTYFAADNGLRNYSSDFHNTVLISGEGQKQQESRVESFVRHVTQVPAAQIVDIDLRLSYSRYLAGEMSGPFAFVSHNPVEFAERQIVSFRGATGPVILVRDHIKKDDERREYDWLFHTPGTNTVQLERRGFQIWPGFAGRYYSTLKEGATIKATLPPDTTGDHLWMLLRPPPAPNTGGRNIVKINGQPAPADAIPFSRGFHREGWRWVRSPIPPKAKALIPGKNSIEVSVTSGTGIEWAAVAISQNADWSPEDTSQKTGGGKILRMEDLPVEASEEWESMSALNVGFATDFLGQQPRSVRLDASPQPPLQGFPPRQRITSRFIDQTLNTLAVMRPVGAKDEQTFQFVPDSDNSAAILSTGNGSDLVVLGDRSIKNPALEFEGDFAVVSRDPSGEVQGFIAHRATKLVFEGRELLVAKTPVDVVNVGGEMAVHSPRPVVIDAASLGARSATINNRDEELADSPSVFIMVEFASEEWLSVVSEDGTLVEFTGYAEGTPSAHAPQARRVHVNGVPRYFYRDDQGRVFPHLQQGAVVFGDARNVKDPGNLISSAHWLAFGPESRVVASDDEVPPSYEKVKAVFSHDPHGLSSATSANKLNGKLLGTEFQPKTVAAPTNTSRGEVDFLGTLGVKRGLLCYAFTELINTSPEPATAQIGLTTDYWAQVLLNGQSLSNTGRALRELDGADYQGNDASIAEVTLSPGRNLLMVKNVGGGASNSFSAYLDAPEFVHISKPK